MSLFVIIYGLQIIVKLCQFKDYIGLIVPAGILVPLPKDGNGNSRGWTGTVVNIAFGFGAGPRLKFVVLPLNALMFKENLAEGDSDANAESQVEAEVEKGFKDILWYTLTF